MQFQDVSQFIADFINNEVKERKSEGVVIGLSGGLDSSVTALSSRQSPRGVEMFLD